MGIARAGMRRAQLVLAWDVTISDALEESRTKPLELLGRALTSPHARSLSAALRARGLSPLAIQADPVVSIRTVRAP